MSYIWEHKNWPSFSYDAKDVATHLDCYHARFSDAENVFSLLKADTQKRIVSDSISDEAFTSSEIEGVRLHYDSIVSSVSRRLGVSCADSKDKYSSEVASVVYDAVSNHDSMTVQRLFEWDGVLTKDPDGVCGFRNGFVGVYSGRAYGHEELVYEAPPAERVPDLVEEFICWLNDSEEEPIIKSAIALFWFVSIHPFADGNGRISRAVADYVLACSSSGVFFSMSKAIQKEKMLYYGLLQKLQGQAESLDLTVWINWYIDLACCALVDARKTFRDVIILSQSMSDPLVVNLNVRQKDILYRMFSKTFYGNLSSEKYCKIEKCSSAQATRDLSAMERLGILQKSPKGGRSTSYELNGEFRNKLISS